MLVEFKKEVELYVSDYSLEKKSLRLDYNGGCVFLPINLNCLQKFRENNNLNPVRYKLPKKIDELYSSRMSRSYDSDRDNFMVSELGFYYDFMDENEKQILYSKTSKTQYSPTEKCRIIEVPEEFSDIGYFYIIDSNIHPANKANEFYNNAYEKSITKLLYSGEFDIEEVSGIFGLDFCQGEEFFDEESFNIVMNSILGIKFTYLESEVFTLLPMAKYSNTHIPASMDIVLDTMDGKLDSNVFDLILQDESNNFFSVKSNVVDVIF